MSSRFRHFFAIGIGASVSTVAFPFVLEIFGGSLHSSDFSTPAPFELIVAVYSVIFGSAFFGIWMSSRLAAPLWGHFASGLFVFNIWLIYCNHHNIGFISTMNGAVVVGISQLVATFPGIVIEIIFRPRGH